MKQEPEPMAPAQEQAIEEFLEGQPRAATWRELREILATRYKEAVAIRDAMNPDEKEFPVQEKRVRELREQVTALAEEEAITRFVEDSVRASLSRPGSPRAASDEDDEEGYY